jgi:hypothetical protein
MRGKHLLPLAQGLHLKDVRHAEHGLDALRLDNHLIAVSARQRPQRRLRAQLVHLVHRSLFFQQMVVKAVPVAVLSGLGQVLIWKFRQWNFQSHVFFWLWLLLLILQLLKTGLQVIFVLFVVFAPDIANPFAFRLFFLFVKVLFVDIRFFLFGFWLDRVVPSKSTVQVCLLLKAVQLTCKFIMLLYALYQLFE